MSKDPQRSPGRADILAAAIHEFANHGFRGASTVRIAKRAGVTQPLVHHHFGSKQGLWSAVVAELFGELEQTLARTMLQVEGADRRTRMAQMLRELVRHVGRRPEISRIIFAESSAGGAPFEELYSRGLSGLVDFFRQKLAAAVEDGTLREVDPQLAYLLIVGACVQPFGEPEMVRRAFGRDMRQEAEVARYADFAADVLLRGLGAEPAPAPRRTRRR